jgi:hypothetical protein
MSYLLAGLFAVVGFYLHTNHLAFKDGVRDRDVFKIAWWRCYKSTSYKQLIDLYMAFGIRSLEATDKDEKLFFAQCALVVSNYMERKSGGNITIKELTKVSK